MGCCNNCEGSPGLGDLSLTKPYHLSDIEIAAFINDNKHNAQLMDYLYGSLQSELPWGIIVPYHGGEFLVWIDATNKRHVINVSGTEIPDQVREAPYVAPGSNLLENLTNNFNKLFGGVADFMTTAAWVLTIYALWGVYKDIRR